MKDVDKGLRKPENRKEEDNNRGEPGGNSTPPLRGFLAWGVILAMVLLMLHLYKSQQEKPMDIPFSPNFVDYVEGGQIARCEVVQEPSGTTYIRGMLKESVELEEGQSESFKVYIGELNDDLIKFLRENKVPFSVPPQNPYIWHLLSSIIPVLLIFGLLYFLFMRQIRSAGSGAMSFGKSRARLLNRDTNKVTFENVAGIDEAKEEVQEIIEFLKDPKKFQNLGGRIPKGVLLMGPPGTGKTLLAKAIAGEADVPFFSISGSDFVEMFVGVGASRVRDMFEQGKKNAPCIMFIDEIDAVGRSRFTGIGGGHDEREQTLNALLVQMDGFETQEGVIILAATNRPDVLDNALLRPGRFDRQIMIDLPMIEGRKSILELHARKLTLSENVDLSRIARGTPGFSGADLENLLNESALTAARNDKEAIENSDLEEARDKVKWGRERRGRVLGDKEREVTAYHEAGHALVMQMIPESEPLHKITIIPRGVAYLGATMQLPEKDRYMESRKELTGMIAGLMGGRVEEELFRDDITSGAASDFQEATRIARAMVCNWGMSEDLGPQSFGQNEELMFLGREIQRTQEYSEETAQKIDLEIHRLLTEGHNHAKKIIDENRDKLEMIVQALLARETIDGCEVEEIVALGRVLTQEERAAKQGQKPPDVTAKARPSETAAKPAVDENPGLETGPGQPDLKPASGIS